MFSGTTQFPIRFVSFFVSSVCLLVRVTVVDKNKAVVCCLLTTDETVGFPEWTAQFSVWKTTGKDSSEAWTIACQNCAVYPFFPSRMMSHSKFAQFNRECIAPLTANIIGLFYMVKSAPRKGGGRYRLPGPASPEGGPEPYYVSHVFVSPRQYHYLPTVTLSSQAQVTPQLTVSLSDLAQRFLVRPPLLEGPNPLSAALR
jgi:hypothetical protein